MKDIISYSVIIGFLLIVSVCLCQGCAFHTASREAGHRATIVGAWSTVNLYYCGNVDADLDKRLASEISPGRAIEIPVEVKDNTIPISDGTTTPIGLTSADSTDSITVSEEATK